MKIPSLLCIAFGCFTLSCSQSTRQPPAPQGDARIVVAIDGHPITVGDLRAEVERHVPGRLLSTLDAKERDSLLEQMIRKQSVYARAVTERFDQSDAIRRQVQELVVSRYLEQREHCAQAEISDDDLQRYYNEHGDKFAIPAQVRIAVIKIGVSTKATEAKRNEACERANLILAQAQAGDVTFDALARLHSEDQATRYLGGDAGWISRDRPDRWDGRVLAAAFDLEKPGDLSPVVSTGNAFYLIQLVERKSAMRRPLSDVKAAIAYQLGAISRERAETQFFNSLQSSQRIEINRGLLESLSSPVQPTESKPPGMPAG